jgi:hypothetical protein
LIHAVKAITICPMRSVNVAQRSRSLMMKFARGVPLFFLVAGQR